MITAYKGQAGYQDVNLPHMSFKKVLNRFNITDYVDLLFIDIEGDEFSLFPEILNHLEDYPIICQINVEFHDPKKAGMIAKTITKKLYEITKQRKYLYLNQSYFNIYHRSFFINVDNSYCLQKYLGL